MSDEAPKAGSDNPLGVHGSKALDPNEFGKFLGLACWLMTMSKEHRKLPMSVLDDRILPAILLKQFRLIKKGDTPVAFLTWALVSDDAKDRLSKPDAKLQLAEWRSGTNLVIIDCVSPFAPVEKVKSDFLSRVPGTDDKH